jgi:hypothetical protein
MQEPPQQLPHINDYQSSDGEVHGEVEPRPELLELGTQPELAGQDTEQDDEQDLRKQGVAPSSALYQLPARALHVAAA